MHTRNDCRDTSSYKSHSSSRVIATARAKQTNMISNCIPSSRLQIATSLGIASFLNLTVATLPGETVPISWTQSGQTLESVLAEEPTHRSQQLACLTEHVLTDFNRGTIPALHHSSFFDTNAVEELLKIADNYRQNQQFIEAIHALEQARSLLAPNHDALSSDRAQHHSRSIYPAWATRNCTQPLG